MKKIDKICISTKHKKLSAILEKKKWIKKFLAMIHYFQWFFFSEIFHMENWLKSKCDKFNVPQFSKTNISSQYKFAIWIFKLKHHNPSDITIHETSYGINQSSWSKLVLLQNFMTLFFFVPSACCSASNIDCFKVWKVWTKKPNSSLTIGMQVP